MLPSRGGEVRNGSRCSGNGEEEIPEGVGGRNRKIAPTFMPFFFLVLFLFFFLFTSAETNDGAKRATWETNLEKQFQEGSGTVQESGFPSPPFRSAISPTFPLLAT